MNCSHNFPGDIKTLFLHGGKLQDYCRNCGALSHEYDYDEEHNDLWTLPVKDRDNE